MAPDADAPQIGGDRYRVDTHLGSGSHMEAWNGHDLRLNRAVTIRVIRADADEAAVRAHLRQAVKVEDPGLSRIYDTLGPDIVGVVTEPLDGESLEARIDEHGPMSLDRATSLTIELAKTLDTAHRQGVTHGGLDARSVGFTSDGRLVISDLGTCGQPEGGEREIAEDVRDLAGLLHHMTSGRRPHAKGRGTEIDPSTPGSVAGLLTAAFSPEPPWKTAHQFATAVASGKPDEAQSPAGFVSAERRWLVPGAMVLLVAALLAVIGTVVGRTSVGQDIIENAREVVGLEPAPTSSVPATTSVSTTTALPPPVVQTTESAILRITDFDPGGDSEEHPERLVLINDQAPDRGWQTEIYNTREFGNLKQGVGLVIELDDPSLLTEVVVRSPTRGWAFELYTADAPPPAVQDWGDAVHIESDIRSDTVISLDQVDATSLLVWIVDLGDGPQYRVTVTDIEIKGVSVT